MKRIAIIIILMTSTVLYAQEKDYSALVNPFIGTGGHGHTYPGVCSPFGMVQLSPDTRLSGWDGCSAYHFSDSVIYGFSHTHLSGTGCSDYGDVLLMPVSGVISPGQVTPVSEFSHKNEEASAGYYSVVLDKYNIRAELTSSPRVGMHRYIFSSNSNNGLFIDLEHRDFVLDAALEYMSDTELRGMRQSKAWAKDQRVYFVLRFSKPILTYDISNTTEKEQKIIKAYLNFGEIKELIVKVGLSATGYEGAIKNLDAEMPEWNFDDARKTAKQSWNKELGKIEVKGGSHDSQVVFYTALYHSMIAPNLYMDVDGNYLGRDMKVHKAEGFDYYTVFSLWDTYRAEHPLLTIIDRKRSNDFVNTFIAQYEQGGRLPVWELSSNETDCMIGYHAVSVITDAYMKGIAGYDVMKAYKAMKYSAEEDRAGLNFYREYGYVPGDKEHESVSKTLEYAYDDWCIATLAQKLSLKDDYNTYIKRAQFYKNVFDPETGFMRPRINGAWLTPFDPAEVTFHYTEANAWQYTFYVPHDIFGLTLSFGYKEKFLARLDELFNTSQSLTGRKQADITGLVGQYAHGNEPSHHMAYLYNYQGQPWKTQEIVHKIAANFYTNNSDGLSGNEDCGQMSAWYVLSALGFYQVCPGNMQFAIGTPLFPEVTIHTENGKAFTITAKNLSDSAFYIQSATRNGQAYNKSYITYEDIMQGGLLEFTMGENPNITWGSALENIPMTSISGEWLLSSPYVSFSSQTFVDSMQTSIQNSFPGCDIYYTTDGSKPDKNKEKYTVPLIFNKTTHLKSIAWHPLLGFSFITISDFYKINPNYTIQLLSKYSTQYTGGGDNALIDGLRGPSNFRLGGWQGYDSVDFEAIIDLGSVQQIHKISAGFLQDIGSWIWMPKKVIYESSDDGITFKSAGAINNTIPDNEYNVVVKDFELNTNIKARYIRVKAVNYGVIPSWHLGAGYTGWIFIDEIMVE